MAGGPCTRLQSRLSGFLEITSGAVDEFQPLVLAFAATLQAQMAYCGALPCPDTPHTLPADDLIGINLTLSGSINGSAVSLTGTPSDPTDCPVQFTGTADDETVVGTYTVVNCTVVDSGTIDITR